MKIIGDFLFFFHSNNVFSNWYPLKFTCGNYEFTCVEQYMMWSKAILFGDQDSASKIMKASTPREMKALGRGVKGFREDIWNSYKESIVEKGLFLKFSQNPPELKILLDTKNLILAEASPYDKIWGIGLGVNHPDVHLPTKWPGQNLLGLALMRVRDKLKEFEIAHPLFSWSEEKLEVALTHLYVEKASLEEEILMLDARISEIELEKGRRKSEKLNKVTPEV